MPLPPVKVFLVEGCSSKAQGLFDQLVDCLAEKPGVVFRMLAFTNLPEFTTEHDHKLAATLEKEARARLAALPAVPHDYVCSEHQCLASWCGCLEEYERNHCSTCGSSLTYDCGQKVCPMCSWPEPE